MLAALSLAGALTASTSSLPSISTTWYMGRIAPWRAKMRSIFGGCALARNAIGARRELAKRAGAAWTGRPGLRSACRSGRETTPARDA
jgi:hypothetical protein